MLHEWSRRQQAVLERDRYLCRLNGPHCTTLPTDVDTCSTATTAALATSGPPAATATVASSRRRGRSRGRVSLLRSAVQARLAVNSRQRNTLLRTIV